MQVSLRAAMAASAVVVGVGATLAGAGTAFAASDNSGNHTVTLCHAKSSDKKPYEMVTVDVDSVLNGHGGHGGDVIPAFSYTVIEGKGKDKVEVEKFFAAKGNQSLLGNGCVVATAQEPPETTVPEEETTVPEEETTVPEEETTVPEEETTVPEEETTVPEEETTVPEEETTVPEEETTVPEEETTVPTPEATVVPADPGTVAPQTEAVTTAPAGQLPNTGAATTGLLVAGFGAMLTGLGLMQLSHTRKRDLQA